MKKWLILMLLAGQAACTSETNQIAASAPVVQSASSASEPVQAVSVVAASCCDASQRSRPNHACWRYGGVD